MASSVLIIGDSHLEHCQTIAEKQHGFGFQNLDVIWKSGIGQISACETAFKEVSDNVNAVFILCGGYDLMTIGDSKSVVGRLKKFVHHVNSSYVKIIIVCSLLDRSCSLLSQQAEVSKAITEANKSLAKQFKSMRKVSLINIRPPGRLKDIMDTDGYHLTQAGYEHVFNRIALALKEKVIDHASGPVLGPITAWGGTVEEVPIKAETKEFTLDKRLEEFKESLLADYKRICTEEKDLNIKLKNLQMRLETTTNEKNKVLQVHEKLFGSDLAKEVM